jgi:hypothetical protein
MPAAPKPADQGRTAYLVLGMHRSGTSAATQVLALAGCDLPQNVMGGDEHNAKGYFEPWKIAMLNDGRMRDGDTAWDDIFAFPYRPLAPKPERQWLNKALALFDEEYGEARYPLLKDPRVTVLMPFWCATRWRWPARWPGATASRWKNRCWSGPPTCWRRRPTPATCPAPS